MKQRKHLKKTVGQTKNIISIGNMQMNWVCSSYIKLNKQQPNIFGFWTFGQT